VVVDDGSTDGSRTVLRRWQKAARFEHLTVIEQEPRGVVDALNAGLEAAAGELVVQLDGDATIETRGWLEPLVTFLRTDSRVGVVTPLIVLDTGRIHACGVNLIGPEGLHDRGSRIAEPAGARQLHTRVERARPADAPELVGAPAEVDASIGACMLYPRALAHELGGYDPGFSPVWFDDLDLSLGARRLGLKVFYVPGAEVLHRMSLRNSRDGSSAVLRAAARARRALGKATPQAVKDLLVRTLPTREFTPEQRERLAHHYGYWRSKWGFDLLNPDMDALLARWGGSEVCWAYDPARRSAGEAIAAGAVASN
jgi:GT2 family glycosyltransferase